MRLRIALILLLACSAVANLTLTGEAAAPAEPYHEVWIDAADAGKVSDLGGYGVLMHEVVDGMARAWVPESTLSLLNRVGIAYYPADEAWDEPDEKQLVVVYGDYFSMTLNLQNFHSLYPDITRLYSLGKSVEGRELWAMLITQNPEVPADKPAFKYVSTMHGDEPVGTPMMLKLIERLLTGYMVDPRITELVNETEIWIVPLMNPDRYGRQQDGGTRRNANAVDLNRNFPIFPAEFTGTIFDGAPLRDEGRQPETQHVMRWSAERSFVLSANIHTGALLVNYPYDDDGLGSVYSPTPDQDVFEHISLVYSQNNPPMFASTLFENGITNGADWFSINGGMQDWNYRYLGCKEVTLELFATKDPVESLLPGIWEDNKESLLVYMEQVHIGVRGLVTDASTGEPVYARIRVSDREQPVFTNPEVGNYHRLLLPGEYTLTIDAPDYLPVTIPGVVVAEGPATRLDVTLEPDPSLRSVPQLTGLTREAAEAALADAGLVAGTITQVASSSAPAGQVLQQSPAPGVVVGVGSSVDMVVSLGAVGSIGIRVRVSGTNEPVLGAVFEVDPPLFSLTHAGNGLYSNTAAPAGQYTIGVVETGLFTPPPPLSITVTSGGSAFRNVLVEPIPDDEPPIDIELFGTLFDADQGGVVTCAIVELLDSSGESRYTAAADDNGFYFFEPLPADSYGVRILAPGFDGGTMDPVDLVGAGPMERDFFLSPSAAAGAINGRVTDADTGQPLVGVLVRGLIDAGSFGDTSTCADGRYELHLPGGKENGPALEVSLEFSLPNFETETATAAVDPAAGTVVDKALALQVPANAELSGVVLGLDEIAHPLENARVTLRGPINTSTVTDAEGRYAFDALLDGRYTVHASKAQYQGASVQRTLPPGGAREADFNLSSTGGVDPPPGVPGDVNGDGVVNAVDVQIVINAALGIASEFDADINDDGVVNAVDVQLVINAALGIAIEPSDKELSGYSPPWAPTPLLPGTPAQIDQ